MQLATQKAPPAHIVLPHYAFAALSFLVLTVLMFFSADSFIGHYFNPKLLTLTHIAALGWGTMIIFGSLYQLLPVILNVQLYSNLLAKITFYFFCIGIIILAYSFWIFSVGFFIQLAAILLLTSATLFLVNIIATARRVEKLNTDAKFIITASIWFWLTVAIGVLMAFNFRYVFLPEDNIFYLKLHAHIGIAGWLILLIMGVGSKLIPMFLLSKPINANKIKYAYYLINTALLGFIIDSLFFAGMQRGIVYLSVAIIGIVFFISYVMEAFKKRARKKVDIGMKQTFYAFVIIAVVLVFGILNNIPVFKSNAFTMQITMVFGVSIFIGFLSLMILGQTLKTLPFIVWLDKYQKLAGKGKIPMPKDLYSEKIANGQFVFFIVGFILIVAGILVSSVLIIKIACLLLIITAALYNINIFKMLFHKTKIEPLQENN